MSLEERVTVPKSWGVRKTKSAVKNCGKCGHFYYATEGRSSCAKLLTRINDFEHEVCLGFKKAEDCEWVQE